MYRDYVVNDTNADGKWTSGELGITGRTVWLDLNNDGIQDSTEPTALTGKNGVFEFDNLAAGTVAYEHRDDIDGLGDERARHGHDAFLNKLLEAPQDAERTAGVDRSDSAGMPGAPRLEQVERLSPANLADRDAVWPQAQG